MSETKSTKATKEPQQPRTKNKLGYILALILGLIIVSVIAFYFIYMGINHAGRWQQVESGSIGYTVFDQTDFIVLRNKDDIEETFFSERYATNQYRLDIQNYDYLIVHYEYVMTESGFYKSLGDARINEITSDGVAKISVSYRNRYFTRAYYDLYGEQEEYVLFEGKKGSFDQIQKLEISGAKLSDSDEPEPDEPYDYISTGDFIHSTTEHDLELEDALIFSEYQAFQDYVVKIRGFEFGTARDQYDFDKYDYAIVPIIQGDCGGRIEKVGLYSVENGIAKVVAEMYGTCGPCAPEYNYYAVPIPAGQANGVELEYEIVNTYHCDPDVAYKPVIYLYPTKVTNVSVKLGAPEKLLVSYPTYIDGWKVEAQPDGNLKDLQTGRGLYSLYYEANNTTTHGLHSTGFVVKGEDTATFLEAKLAELGLNDREAEEFIIYWLPQMQGNAYNYIYFATGAEASKNMPLEVSPAPKTSIRINMEWKALDAPIEVKPQVLPKTPTRDGFTLVEWGGTIL